MVHAVDGAPRIRIWQQRSPGGPKACFNAPLECRPTRPGPAGPEPAGARWSVQCGPGTAQWLPGSPPRHGRHPAFAPGAFQRVHPPHALEQLGPFHRARRRHRCGLFWMRVAPLAVRGLWNHQLPVLCTARQNPEVLPRGMSGCRNQAAQPRQEARCGERAPSARRFSGVWQVDARSRPHLQTRLRRRIFQTR